MRKLLISSISATMLILGGCATTHHNGAKGASGSSANSGQVSDQAMAKGIGQGSSFSGQNSKLLAPNDQVYHFAFDSDAIKAKDRASVIAQANYLVAHGKARVRLEGNTDERGSREYNVALGWRRAKAVASFLKQEGVRPQQIVTISYGEEKPVAYCHNESCWQLNRRVNLVYEAK